MQNMKFNSLVHMQWRTSWMMKIVKSCSFCRKLKIVLNVSIKCWIRWMITFRTFCFVWRARPYIFQFIILCTFIEWMNSNIFVLYVAWKGRVLTSIVHWVDFIDHFADCFCEYIILLALMLYAACRLWVQSRFILITNTSLCTTVPIQRFWSIQTLCTFSISWAFTMITTCKLIMYASISAINDYQTLFLIYYHILMKSFTLHLSLNIPSSWIKDLVS